jgi:polar amino acid transport system substrate-binding protein
MMPARLTGLILLLSTLAFSPLAAAADQTPLRVGVVENPPFAMRTDGVYTGYSIDLWNRISQLDGYSFRLVPVPSGRELLDGLRQGTFDVGLSDLSITSQRLTFMDFSHPFFDGGLQIMINEKRRHPLGALWNWFTDPEYLWIYGSVAGLILLLTVTLTVVERRLNKDFHEGWFEGMCESFYHVVSVALTGKTSHKPLPGFWSHLVGALWILCGVGIVAYVTATFTSVVTVEMLRHQINGPSDLPGKTVGVIAGTTSAEYARSHDLDAQSFSDLPSAVQALVKRQIDAIVYDAPILQYYDAQHPELPITEVGPVFDRQGYGFGFPLKSPVRHDINEALLRLIESGEIDRLQKQYFGH